MTVRAAVYNRFWHSRGGGERYSGMLAQVLAQDGVRVDLLGHADVDTADLGSHLGLDLSGTTSRAVPDLGPTALATRSADYDLFINGTHMSRFVPASARSAYVCYFPTPLDAGLANWRRALGRSAVGRYARGHQNLRREGWFAPEGGPKRQWAWTNGNGVLELPPGPARVLAMQLGRPGAFDERQVLIETGQGTLLAAIQVGARFTSLRLIAPESAQPLRLHVRSPAAPPSD
ncbi:MAG TPA: hypothetical protein VNA30_06225, partial [Mycobacteriales bacterium]|nr:hypothetical protein [Mycobacteriales bacterium]